MRKIELQSHHYLYIFTVFFVSLFVFLFFAVVAQAQQPVGIEWIRQFGSTNQEDEVAVDIDTDGNVYVTGFTTGVLPGKTSIGDHDAFLRKYDTNGNEVWTRQFGTSAFDQIFGISIESGNIYVTGITEGAFPTYTNTSGQTDVFVRKYSATGTEIWTHQIQATSSEEVFAIETDSTGVYIGGFTTGVLPGQTSIGGGDAFIRKYDLSGNELWTRQFGTSAFDQVSVIVLNASSVFASGITGGTLPGSVGSGDVFVRQYDTNGTLVGTSQFGEPDGTEIFGSSVDSDGVYIVGFTNGTLPNQESAGQADAFIRKYDLSGSELWTRQFGTSAFDQAFNVIADPTGIYVIGVTDGTLAGQTSSGGTDVFARKYDTSGNELWTFQFGTSQTDEVFGISIFSTGVYVAGSTRGTFSGQTNTGETDAFVAKLVQDDTDNDGIFDEIDTQPTVFSDDFDDGATTTGSITTRGGQTLTIRDATSSIDGVVASADSSGLPPKARINACGSNFNLNAGDSVVITCSSVTAEVLSGVVEIEFFGDDGTSATVNLEEGNTLTFDSTTVIFTAPLTNPDPVVVLVDGAELLVGRGQTIQLVGIDIKSGPADNCLNPNARGAVTVVVLATDSFDAFEIESDSVKFDGTSARIRGRSGNIESIVDIDGDGDLDFVVQFSRAPDLADGQTTVILTGETESGMSIQGFGAVCVVPPGTSSSGGGGSAPPVAPLEDTAPPSGELPSVVPEDIGPPEDISPGTVPSGKELPSTGPPEDTGSPEGAGPPSEE